MHRERPKGTVVTQYHTQGGRADAGTQTGGAENAVLPELGGGGTVRGTGEETDFGLGLERRRRAVHSL